MALAAEAGVLRPRRGRRGNGVEPRLPWGRCEGQRTGNTTPARMGAMFILGKNILIQVVTITVFVEI